MKILLASALLICAGACVAATDTSSDDNPGSLWSNDKPNPFLDRTARKEGDILTIIISETSTASFTAATDNEKTEANSVSPTTVPILGTLMPNLAGASNGSLSTKTTGLTSQAGSFLATMSAVVKKVLPNGNLIIEGTRYVKISKDIQTFVLTGMVRRDDVRADNSVLSASLADADIKVEGKGPIADRQRKGILSRLLDWLF